MSSRNSSSALGDTSTIERFYEALRRAEAETGDRPGTLLVSPRTMAAYRQEMETSRWYGPPHPEGEPLTFMGARVVVDPLVPDDVAYAMTVPRPPTPGGSMGFAEALRDYLPSHLLREELANRSGLMGMLPRNDARGEESINPFESRGWGYRSPRPKPTKLKRTKQAKNWERRMMTSLEALAREYA